ncbi:hypothetical protein CXB51_016543 [Gossypium anomalum]|uniref:Uncharacterized protein n=4 Tax=Gossypium TaxID=3633 RepID=A0A8J5Z481_9ROSI|nr:hypothetical protein ES319_A07G096900v1 [Gossypium barbadense]KAG4191374.1 hypothetical protein ERO13_A07G088700v2 [Gossypium hirsutum]KAG8488410.1 hypothetical protein CXB51_016543 [Gossypium anomalum]TYI18611.1 hypothetical protein ES332_A07G103300v1 [Gossypium tomentosum]TYJ26155.1 hypothetical protein E1A91_A07G099000v1 [Gossypium mustelinum]
MSSQYPDNGYPNGWSTHNSDYGGGSSSTTGVWIAAGVLIAILVLLVIYYFARKGKLWCFSCKIEFGSGHTHHGSSKC